MDSDDGVIQTDRQQVVTDGFDAKITFCRNQSIRWQSDDLCGRQGLLG